MTPLCDCSTCPARFEQFCCDFELPIYMAKCHCRQDREAFLSEVQA